MVFKVITKLINNRIKPLLDKSISKEYFDFLLNKKILEDMGVDEDILCLIEVKKLKVLIIKMDLF